jgi:tRNA pseudouridine55 synthase
LIALMARQRKGLPVNGWLVLDKPQGMTSTTAVARVKRLYEAAKAGHAGTLDPLATGVLPIALGEATKTVPFVMDGSKSYRFTIRFGSETDTEDAEGKVVVSSEKRPTRAEIESVLPGFTGEIAQVPPRFSALKVECVRAYDLARDEEAFELAPRTVVIDRLALIENPDADHAVLEAECGKGTYVRALARDLGRALGTTAHLGALRRTRSGALDITQAHSLEELSDAADVAMLFADPLAALGLPVVKVDAEQATRLATGAALPGDANGLVAIAHDGVLLGVYAGSEGALKPQAVIPGGVTGGAR